MFEVRYPSNQNGLYFGSAEPSIRTHHVIVHDSVPTLRQIIIFTFTFTSYNYFLSLQDR